MKQVKRFLVVRTPGGDDAAVNYEVPRFECMADVERFYGVEQLLRIVQDHTEKHERQSARAQAMWQMRQQMATK
ncbi:hypothetical protein EHM76_04460 [bacterium]|nr:MAG: hypothetical protein EHM76_04460 [bacterium]